MPLAAKTRLGTYEILAPLGTGGMGEVYRARDTRLGRDVALKVLRQSFDGDDDRLARFEREARTVAAFNHPNIVVLHSIEEEEGLRFLTMELIEGQTLDEHIAPDGLPGERLLELGMALSDALAAAHEKGIVHRDLKPANVMVTREGRVKVLDFGLAKLVPAQPVQASAGAAPGGPVSTPGVVMGTVPYMAPEQILGETVDARTDLFALGIILYELAAGRRPFHGKTASDVIAAILKESPAPLEDARGDLPRDLIRVIHRCLEKDPLHRLQTARDVHRSLRAAWRDVERRVPSPAPRPAAMSRTLVMPAPEPRREVPSIAVLPFVNRSHNEEDEYFSDGLADELLNVLAKIRGLRVAARTSSFTFKGKDTTIAEMGRALNVATVLEGSVRWSGNRVRIAVQLVNVADGYPMWSETYDRLLEDIFAVQDDIAQAVVKSLRAALLSEPGPSGDDVRVEVAEAARGRGTHAEAHRLFLQARYFIDRRSREDLAKGIDYLKEALELDPRFAIGRVELARAYATEADLGWAGVAEGYARARQAVESALSLEPDLAEAHAQMGAIQRAYDWDWRGASASIRRARELAPGNAAVLRQAALMARNLGHSAEAIDLLRQALEQDPLSGSTYNAFGWALHSAGALGEAEPAYRKAIELHPQRIYTHALLALTLLAQGRSEEALAEATREPDEAFALWSQSMIHHAAGRDRESQLALEALIGKHSDAVAYQIAEVHAVRGEADAAFAWMEQAREQRDGGLTDVLTSPHFRSLHRDPRWSAFLVKMRLVD